MDGWRSNGDGSFVVAESGATATFSGPLDAISLLLWRISDSDGALMLSIDGNEPTTLSGTDGSGVESIELPLRIPSAFVALLLAIGTLFAAIAPWVCRQISPARGSTSSAATRTP